MAVVEIVFAVVVAAVAEKLVESECVSAAVEQPDLQVR